MFQLVQAGRRQSAARALREVLVPSYAHWPHAVARWRVELAQIARQERDFQAAAAELDAAQALLDQPDSADAGWSARARFFCEGGRVLLAIQLGAPDLAGPHLERARAAAATLDDELLLIDQNYFELAAKNAMLRPALALEAWSAFEREHASRAFPPDRLARNRLRAAQSAVDLVASGALRAEEAQTWLERVGDPANLPAGEAGLALQLRATLALDAEQPAQALATIQQARAALARSGSPLRERAEQLASLEVRALRLLSADAAQLRAARDELAQAFEAALAVWRALPPRAGGVGPLRYRERREVLGELALAELALDPGPSGMERALSAVMAVQAVGSAAREVGAPPPTQQELQSELLAERRGALFYLPTRRELHVFALDGRRATHHEVRCASTRLDELRDGLLRQLGRVRSTGEPQDVEELERLRRELSVLLFPPELAERLASWDAVAIVGPETLGYLPFELLLSSGERALGATHAVAYWPSFPLALWLQRTRARPPVAEPDALRAALLVCSDPGPDGPRELERLELSAQEERRVRGGVDAARLVLERGPAVTAESFARRCAESDLVHLIAHGRRDGLAEQPLRLALWGAEELKLSDLDELRFPSLTILTACGAQSGQMRRGDDGRHRSSGALLRRGARAAVLAELDVDFDFALEFFGLVHAQLLNEGASVENALRHARAACAERTNVRARYEPHLFHVWGLPDFVLVEPTAERTVGFARSAWFALGALAAALALFAWKRRRRDPKHGSDRGAER